MERPMELFYASTQENIINGSDGFGIRYKDDRISNVLIERIKERQIFQYNSGNKRLTSVAEIIENPESVKEHEPIYTFFEEEVEGKRYCIFSRTVYLGRDYGWYLTEREDAARSGNTATHIFISSQKSSIFIQHLKEYFPRFIPRNTANEPTNLELRSLLTGPPPSSIAPLAKINDYSIKTTNESNIVHLICFYLESLESSDSIVIQGKRNAVFELIIELYSALPLELIRKSSFQIGFQEYGFSKQFGIIGIDDNYQGSKPKMGQEYLFLNLDDQSACSSLTSPAFLKEFGNSGDFIKLKSFLKFLDTILISFKGRLEWGVFLDVWRLSNGSFGRSKGEKKAIPAIIDKINRYSIKNDFKKELKTKVSEIIADTLKNQDFQTYTSLFNLVIVYELQKEPEFNGSELTKMIDASLHEFIKADTVFIQKNIEWMDNGKSKTYIKWLTNESICNPIFKDALIKFIAKNNSITKNPKELVLFCVERAIDKNTLYQLYRAQFHEDISLESHDFFPEINEVKTYQDYFELHTLKYIERQVISQEFKTIKDKLLSSFKTRTHLKNSYLLELLKMTANNNHSLESKLAWLVCLDENKLGNKINESVLNKILSSLLDKAFLLSSHHINTLYSLHETVSGSALRYINQLLKLHTWNKEGDPLWQNTPIQLLQSKSETARLILINSSSNHWNKDGALRLVKLFSELFPDKYWDSDRIAKLNDERFWSSLLKRTDLDQQNVQETLIIGLFMYSKLHGKRGKRLLTMLKTNIHKWEGIYNQNNIDRIIESTTREELKKWLIKIKPNRFQRIIRRMRQ